MKTKQEYSAGGPVFRKFEIRNSKIEVKWLLGKHSGYDKWVLPKGMIEEEETPEETAVRETEEEMGVMAKIIQPEPVYVDQYSYVAQLKKNHIAGATDANGDPVRRVQIYQENENFVENQDTVKVEKTVTFFLMEYVSGDEKEHGWEMADAGWFTLEEAIKKMSFEGEKIALRKAAQILDTIDT